MCVCICSGTQLCLTLCDPMNYSPPVSSVHGVFQARILEWVTISSSKGSSRSRDQTSVSCVSCIAGRSLTIEPSGKPYVTIRSDQIRSVAQSCPTLCDPMNRSTPASLSITNSRSSLRLTSIESVMPSSHLILCRPLLLLPPIVICHICTVYPPTSSVSSIL